MSPLLWIFKSSGFDRLQRPRSACSIFRRCRYEYIIFDIFYNISWFLCNTSPTLSQSWHDHRKLLIGHGWRSGFEAMAPARTSEVSLGFYQLASLADSSSSRKKKKVEVNSAAWFEFHVGFAMICLCVPCFDSSPVSFVAGQVWFLAEFLQSNCLRLVPYFPTPVASESPFHTGHPYYFYNTVQGRAWEREWELLKHCESLGSSVLWFLQCRTLLVGCQRRVRKMLPSREDFWEGQPSAWGASTLQTLLCWLFLCFAEE